MHTSFWFLRFLLWSGYPAEYERCIRRMDEDDAEIPNVRCVTLVMSEENTVYMR
jgi:hypothetical protein